MLLVFATAWALCAARPLGAVSSVWTAQLSSSSVPELVSRLGALGVSYIELRQGSLPGFEDPTSHLPDAAALATLARRFPTIVFSYACSLPFLSAPAAAANSTLFTSALATSVALAQAGNGFPVLRIVDVTTGNKNYNASVAGEVVAALGAMANAAAKHSIQLAVENAMLEWAVFFPLLFNASGAPALVFDPCNLAWVSDGASGAQTALRAALSQIDSDNTVLLHAKQVVASGTPVLPEVGAGALDWAALASAFNSRAPSLPLLLEVAPSAALWDCLDRSVAFLAANGFQFE